MATAKKVEDLSIWRVSRELVRVVYSTTGDDLLQKDRFLFFQIRSSAVSIPANIAEGLGRGGNKEFIQFLSIARGSAYELESHLRIAESVECLDSREVILLLERCKEVQRQLTGFIEYLRQMSFKGSKFL